VKGAGRRFFGLPLLRVLRRDKARLFDRLPLHTMWFAAGVPLKSLYFANPVYAGGRARGSARLGTAGCRFDAYLCAPGHKTARGKRNVSNARALSRRCSTARARTLPYTLANPRACPVCPASRGGFIGMYDYT